METAIYITVFLVALGALWLDIVFFSSLLMLIFSKKVSAYLIKIDLPKDSYRRVAFYDYDGEEYQNIFPFQDFFEKKLYPKNTLIEIRIVPCFHYAIDKVTQITIFIGCIFSLVMSFLAYFLVSFVLF